MSPTGERGKEWVTKNGSSFGLMNGMGSAGRKYEPGKIHRSDRMASTGLYADGEKGIRRLTDPDLRLKDQDRDGVQAEVLYGILGATNRLNDNEAAGVDAAHLQRLARRFLRPPSRALRRPRQHPQPQRRGGGRRDRARRQARQRARARGRAAARHDAAVGPLVEPGVGRHRRQRAAGAFPHDRRARPRLLQAHRQDAARRARRQHLQLSDAHGRRVDVDDLRRRAAPPPEHEDGDRRGRHRLDPLHPRPHGRASGRTSSRNST